MKAALHVLASVIILTVFNSPLAAAAEPSSAPKPAGRQTGKTAEWNVSVEVLMVAMPQEKAIAVLPDLRDAEKIDGAVTQILKAIEKKEVTLTGWPMARTLDGVRCVTESIFEKRYPTEFDVPLGFKGQPETKPDADKLLISEPALPTAFETRNTGATLEVEPHIQPGGEWIKLELVPQRVVLLGFDVYSEVKTASGGVSKIDQPQFCTVKTTTSTMVRNGQWNLMAIHKSPLPDNQIEFFIVRAFATPSR